MKTVNKLAITFSFFVLLAISATAQTVTSISPLLNSRDVSTTSNVVISFSEAMDNATITSETVIISGSQRGIYSGSFSYGATSATFDPDDSFFAGEIITVVVTEGVEDASNDPITAPYRTMFTAAATGDAEFRESVDYTVHASSFTDYSIGADVDEDGDIDIITLTSLQNRMSVFINDGTGSYTGPTNYTTANSFQVEAKDVDGNGSIDLVTSNNNAFMMSVFINNGSGSGTFASKVDYANGSSWNGKALTTGDIDNDGDEDVLIDIIIGGAVDSIQVFLNDGDGTFTVTDGISTTGGFEQLKMADIDGDEDLDLIGVSPELGQLWSWKNDGTGSFSANTTSAITTSSIQFALANFNGNGPIDAITTDQSDDEISIITEDNSFLFAFNATPVNQTVGDAPNAISSGDLDGDGDIDVVVSNSTDQNLSILINNGSASFTESNYSTSGTYANYISLADVDGDGDLDIITGNQDGTISVIKNYPGPTISSITPAHGASDITASNNIAIKFDEGMDSGTMGATTVQIIGSLTGLYGGSYTYTAGDSTLTINPTDDFAAGEVVTVVVTTGVESTLGVAMESGSSTNFVVAAGDGEIFGTANTYTAGDETNAVTLADVNDDGDIDIVVVNTTADSVAILISNGDGTFDSPVNYYAGDAPADVAVGDLDGDGDIDLLVSTTTDNVLSRFLNNGDGTFAARSTFATTSGPGSISLGDIDNDGDLDTYYSANNVMYTQSNNGSGTFSSESVWGTNASVITAPVDLNGDGLADYVGLSGISLRFVLNDGDGTYSYGSSSLAGSGSGNGVVTGDFDGDGDIDIISSYTQVDGYIAFSANNGSGGYAGAVSYTLSGNSNDSPGGLSALDIDGDGDLDIAVVNTDFDEVVIFINDGSGVFTNDAAYSTGDSPEQVSSADLNGDGIMDLVVANSADDNVSVLLGGEQLEISSASPDVNDIDATVSSDIDIEFNQSVQSGTVTTSTVTAVGSVSGSIAGAVSYDGGSNTATLNPTADFIAGETITVFVTTGVSTSIGSTLSSASQYSFTVGSTGGEIFLSPADYEFTNDISDLKFVDFDNDGDADIVSAENGSNGGLAVYLNDGSGGYTFSDTTASSDTEVSNITIADFDQDGYMDAAGTVENMSGFFIQVFINDQAGSFSAPVEYSYSTDYAAAIDAADINKDGYPDIVATRYNGNAVHVLLNDGDGTFTSQTAVTVGGGPYLAVKLIDVDSDSDLDLVTTDWDDNTISIAKNNGDGTFATHTAFNMTGSGLYTGTVESGDIDGDGDLDLVASQTDDEDDPVSGITVFLNDGSGDYSTTATIAATANDIELLDMDGDGDLDLVLANEGLITVLHNDGLGSFTASAYTATAGDTWIYAIDASDIDGDGDIDLAAGTYDALHIFMNGDLVNISSTSPSANGLNVSVSSNITVTFGVSMDVTTFQDTSVIVTGSQSGVLGRGLSLSNPTLTIDPANDFIPGEVITVLLTNDLESSTGTALYNPNSFSFTVAASGNGNMIYRDSVALSNSVFRLISADVDNDGDEDLIGTTNSIIDVYEYDSGSYSFLAQSVMPSGFESVYTADIDGDGDLDLAVHPFIGTNQFRFLENNGSGSFTITDTLIVSSAADDAVFQDFDGDGNLDLAYIYGAQLAILNWGNGDFSFTGSSNFGGGSGYPTPSSITSGDVDNDGDIDIILIGDDKLVVGINYGSRSFSDESILDVAADPSDVELADFDGDGYLDIVVTSEEGAAFSVFINDGDGTFGAATEYSISPYWATRVTPFDYDGDGDIDLAMYMYDDNEGTDHMLFAYNSSGTFSNQLIFEYPVDDPYYYDGADKYFSLLDIDGDGDLDIASLVGNSSIAFAENAAGSSSAPTVAATSVSTSSVAHSSAKISWTNGDGARRLVVVKEGSAVNATPVDNTGYNPNSAFESGTELGTGNFAVYGGASNSVVVTGLESETEYHIQVFELNGIPGSEKFYTTSAPTGSFTTAEPPLVWSKNDSTLVFTKANFADHTLEANQDRISDNLWITRGESGYIFNYADEVEFDSDISPNGTQWALGTTDDIEGLDFMTFGDLWSGNLTDIAGNDMVVYIESDNLYFDINFISWQSGSSNGGGFSYTRAKGPEPSGVVQTFDEFAGNAVQFDGGNLKDEYIEIYIEDYEIVSQFSVEMWVKPDVINQDQVFLALDSDELFIGINSSNKFYATHTEPNSGSGGEEEEGGCCPDKLNPFSSSSVMSSAEIDGSGGTITASAGEWYHVALTGESGGFLTLYVNGVEQDTASIDNVSIDDSYWVVGSDEDRSKNFFGTIDELRIWKSVRTVSQIRSFMHRAYSGQVGRLTGYWQFNEGSGGYTYDGLNNYEGEFYDDYEDTWVTSDVPIGQGTSSDESDFQNGTATLGNAAITMSDGFDNPVDIQVTEVASSPNSFPTGYSAGLGGKYFVINLFGTPGTFSADLTLTFGSGVITAGQESTPSTLKLYKRSSTSSGEWTDLGGATTAVESSGVVTWTGITSFSQFIAVDSENAIPAADDPGTVLTFSGDEYVHFDYDAVFNPSDEFTIEFWAKPTGGTGSRMAISSANGSTTGYQIAVDNDDKWLIKSAQSGSYVDIVGPDATLNEWQHVAAVYDGSKVYLYINGEKADSTSTFTYVPNPDGLFVLGGYAPDTTTNEFVGSLDEFRIWSVARTDEEIQSSMFELLSGSETNLNGYWRLDENEGSTAYDYTSNDNNGTLTAGPTYSTDVPPAGAFIYGSDDGWHFLSNPATGVTLADFLEPLWTQGATDADDENGNPNVFELNETTGAYVGVTDLDVEATPGKGYLVYVYSDDVYNVSGVFPKMITTIRTARPTSKELPVTYDSESSFPGFSLVGNPHPNTIDLENSSWVFTNTNPSVYVYDDEVEAYRTYNRSLDVGNNGGTRYISALQGFLVEASGSSPALSIPASAASTVPIVLFKQLEEPLQRIQLEISSEGRTEQTQFVFNLEGSKKVGPPTLQLESLTGNNFMIYSHDAFDRKVDITELPKTISGYKDIPIGFESTTSGEVTLTASLFGAIPEEMEIFLLDNNTGKFTDLKGTDGYKWQYNAPQTKQKSDSLSLNPVMSKSVVASDAGIESQFTLRVGYGVGTSLENEIGIPQAFALQQNYPNPFNPVTTINYELPLTSHVRLEIFDVLGRKAVTLIDGEIQAGYHQVRFDARNLASGMYLYRLQAGSTIITKKLTLIK